MNKEYTLPSPETLWADNESCYTCREYYNFVPFCIYKNLYCIFKNPYMKYTNINDTKPLCRDIIRNTNYCYYNPFDSKIDWMIAIMKSEHPEIF